MQSKIQSCYKWRAQGRVESSKSWITLCQFPSLLLCLWKMILSCPSDILILPLAMYNASKGTVPAPGTWRISPLVDVVLMSREKWGLMHVRNTTVLLKWLIKWRKWRKIWVLILNHATCGWGPPVWGCNWASCPQRAGIPAGVYTCCLLEPESDAAEKWPAAPPFDKNPTNNSSIHSQAALPGVFSIHGGDRDCTHQEWLHVPLVTAGLGQQA